MGEILGPSDGPSVGSTEGAVDGKSLGTTEGDVDVVGLSVPTMGDPEGSNVGPSVIGDGAGGVNGGSVCNRDRENQKLGLSVLEEKRRKRRFGTAWSLRIKNLLTINIETEYRIKPKVLKIVVCN